MSLKGARRLIIRGSTQSPRTLLKLVFTRQVAPSMPHRRVARLAVMVLGALFVLIQSSIAHPVNKGRVIRYKHEHWLSRYSTYSHPYHAPRPSQSLPRGGTPLAAALVTAVQAKANQSIRIRSLVVRMQKRTGEH